MPAATATQSRDSAVFTSPFGEIVLPSLKGIESVESAKLECRDAVTDLVQEVLNDSHFEKSLSEYLKQGKIPDADAQRYAEVIARGIAGSYADADYSTVKTTKFDSSEQAVAAVSQVARQAFIDHFNGQIPVDLELKNAIDALGAVLSNGVTPALTQDQVLEKLADWKIEALGKQKFVLETVDQKISFAAGQIEVEFVPDPSGGPTAVAITNTVSGLRATFAPATFSPAMVEDYENLLDGLGRLRAAASPVEPPRERKVPNFSEVKDIAGFERLYTYLQEITLSNLHSDHVSFSYVAPASALGIDDFDELESALLRQGIASTRESIPTSTRMIQDLEAEQVEYIAKRGSADLEKQLCQLGGRESIVIDAAPGMPPGFEMVIRKELGDYFADLQLVVAGRPLTVSFCIARHGSNNPIDIQEKLDTFVKIADNFQNDNNLKTLGESETFRGLLSLGEIVALKGEKNRPVEIKNVNLLGAVLAPGAVIENVKFTDSVLDFSGVGASITNCTFTACQISFLLREAEISRCTFDKKSMIVGELAGTIEDSTFHSNAYGLDARGVALIGDALKDPRRAFKSSIFNIARMPPQLKSHARTVGQGADKFLKEFEASFMMAAFDQILHHYSKDDPHHSYKPFYSPSRYLPSRWADDITNQVVPSFKSMIDKQKVLDIYPPGSTAADHTEDTEVLRIFVDRDKLRYTFGKRGLLRDTFDAAERSHMLSAEGNFAAFRATLQYLHGHRISTVTEPHTPVTIP